MRRLPFLHPLLVVLLLAACKKAPYGGPVAVTPPPPQPLRIAFVPPDGKLLHERSITTRTEAGVTERVEATMTSRYDHQEGGGWVLTQWVPKLEVTRAGEPVKTPLIELVTRFPVKLELADDGAFVRLANPEDAAAAVESTFSEPQEAAKWASFFSPAAIEQQSHREWDSKYAGLFNRNLEEGEKLYALESVLAGGEPRYYLVERTLAGRSQSAFGQTAVFNFRCTGNAAEVKDNDIAQRLIALWGNPPLETSVQCEGQQLVAISPFVPTRTWMRLTARPTPDGPEVTLNREVTAHKLE